MSDAAIQFEKPYAFTSSYDRTIEMLLGCVLVFGPLALGSVQPWSELVLLLLVTCMVGAFFGRLLLDPHSEGCRWSWTYLPLIAFLLLVAAQLLPLPWGLLGTVSPATAGLKQQLLSDLPGGLPASSTLSFYPYATWHDLRILLGASALFIVVSNTFRGEEQIRRLLAIIAIAGALVVIVALYQDLKGTSLIYDRFATHSRAATAGPFVNYNNYSQFTNLSIGAAISLLLLRLRDRCGSRPLNWRRFSDIFKHRNGWIAWSLLIGILLAAGSIALSTSRMGFLSMIVAAIGVGIATRSAHGMKGRGSVFALIGFTFFCILLLVGFEAVYARLATLQVIEGEHTPYSARWQTLVDLVPVWKQFPILGIGMGSHPFAFHMFDRSGDFIFTGHVENEYAQLLEETGILGIGIVLAFAVMIVRAYRATLAGSSRFAVAVAIGMGYGLTAVLIHSLSDFGQHIPSIALLSAVVCGILLNVAPARWQREEEGGRARGREGGTSRRHIEGESGRGRKKSGERIADSGRRKSGKREPYWLAGVGVRSPLSGGQLVATGAAAMAVLGIFLFAISSAYSASVADDAFTTALGIEGRLAADNWQGDDWDFARLIVSAEKAAKLQPTNIQYTTALNTYRWRAISQTRDPATGQTLFDQEALGYAKRIAADTSASRVLCPTYGPPYSLLGQIEHFVLSDPAGPGHIATGYRLAPYDVACCYAAGLADALGKRWDDSMAKFRRLGEAGAIQSAAGVYIRTFRRPDLAMQLAGDDPEWLLAVANALQQYDSDPLWRKYLDGAREWSATCLHYAGPALLHRPMIEWAMVVADEGQIYRALFGRPLAAEARASAAERLRSVCADLGAPARMLGALAGLCVAQDDHPSAITYYRRALDLEYGRIDWRLSLARSLEKTGDVVQAMKEARTCLHLRPGYAPAKQLVGELALLPGAVDAGR